MKKIPALLAVILMSQAALSTARAYTHPGIPFTVADLDAVKANLTIEPWKSGYTALAAQGQSQLTYAMQGPFASVSRTPDTNLNQWKNDMQAVYNLSRMWYYTGNSAYGQKARDILMAWVGAHTSFDGAEMYLSMGDYAYRVFGGASILRGTWPGWTQADTDACKAYFNTVWWNGNSNNAANPLRSANQGALQLASCVGVAVFSDDPVKFAQCLQAYRADINGGLADSLPNGQVGDSGRDQGHAGGQIWSLAWMAEVFWKQGVDVYAEMDNRLLAAGEFYSRYNYAVTTPYIPFGAKYDYYWNGHGGLPKSAERAPDALNVIHSAYVVRKGMSAPWLSLYRATRLEGADSFDYRKMTDGSTAIRPAALTPPASVTPAITGDLTNTDIGTATPAGSGTYANGTWTVIGGGSDIWGGTDSYHYAYKHVAGDFTMIAKVASLLVTSANAKAGLVMCDSLTATAPRRIYFGYTPGVTAPRVETHLRGYSSNSHNDPDELTHDGPTPMLPQWLKIQRIGSRVSYYHCSDGINWVPLQNAEYTGWTDTAYVGLGVCSYVNGTPTTATFTNVSLTGGSGTETAVAPSAPLAVYASPGNRQVPLRWMPVRGATAYNIKRSTISGSGFSTIATVADGDTSYTDYALTNGITYFYAVSAVNSAGESSLSPQDSVTPLPPIIRVEAETYAAQAGIQLENCSEGGQNVSYIGNGDWTRYTAIDFGTGATTFQARVANPSAANTSIEVRLDSITGTLAGIIPVPVTGGYQNWATSTITLSGVTGVHDVYLKFITGGFNLNWFEYQRLDAPAPIAVPAAPAGLAASPITVSRINLAWSAASGATRYRVKRATTSGGPYTVIAESLLSTSLSDTDLLPATAYYYVVSALNSGGESANSTQVTATTYSLPVPWASQDIGAVGLPGGANHVSGTFTVKGSGTDIQGTADLFHFTWRQLTGDGAIVARVASLTSGDQWAKSGVMMRESLASNSINTCMVVSKSNGVSWQRRTTTGGATSVSTTGGIASPHWVKLVRAGDTFTAYTSADGQSWTQRGSQSITMAPTLYVGLAVCARNNTQINTSTFDNVTVATPPAAPTGLTATPGAAQVALSWNAVSGATGYTVRRSTTSGSGYVIIATDVSSTTCADTTVVPGVTYYYAISAVNDAAESGISSESSAVPAFPPPPSPWVTLDIGAVGATGSAIYNAGPGAYTLDGSGADIWNSSDEFLYVYQTATGDCSITARVTGITNTNGWAKAGVMIRESTAANSRHAMTVVTPASGISFQYRATTGGASGNVTHGGLSTPYWVRIVRVGDIFTASRSPDGVTQWTTMGAITIPMTANVLIGLPVTSHSDSTLCTAIIDNVTVAP